MRLKQLFVLDKGGGNHNLMPERRTCFADVGFLSQHQ
jgi:hypothetical protein